MSFLRRLVAHLRIYESTQILAPGFFGILSLGRMPSLHLLVIYSVCFWCHVLSVYSYNDYCDWESDAENPRKADSRGRSRRWLGVQTVVLTGIFLTGTPFLPGGVMGVLLVSQAVCMVYSDPRVRLKGLPLGGEAAHFIVGFCYFISGIILAGGNGSEHLLGGILFGLLYVTGGTFNEIMDADSDRKARLRHIVVLMGRRKVLRALFVVHAACFALLYSYEPGLIMLGFCLVLALGYLRISWRLAERLDDPGALLKFRRGYRFIFSVLLVVLSALRITGVAGG